MSKSAALLLTPYPHEERAKARAGYRRLDHLADVVRDCAVRGNDLPPAYRQPVAAITKTEDIGRQLEVLESFAERVKGEHLGKLRERAKHDFSAFCEVITPEEPPESPFHIWLTNLLQDVEMNPDRNKLVLNVPPGHAKPLHVSTLVSMADGSRIRLDEVRVGDMVLTHEGRAREVTAVHEQGVLPLLRLTTAQGRQVLSAPDHPFLVWAPQSDGSPDALQWVKAEHLTPGDLLAPTVNEGRAPDDHEAREEDIHITRMWGYMALGGALTFQKPKHMKTPSPDFRLSSSDRDVMRDVKASADYLELKMSICKVASQQTYVARLGAAAFRQMNHHDWFTYDPTERRCPPQVFTGDDAMIAEFLSAALTVRAEHIRRRPGRNLRLSHRSMALLEDLQHLCLRLGAAAVIERPDAEFGGRAWLSLDDRAVAALLAAGVTFPSDRFAAAVPLGPRPRLARPDRDAVVMIEPAGEGACRCLTVDEDHSFVAGDLAVHNSTYASRLFVAWRLGRDPNQRIIGGGHGQSFVENEFSKAIKDIVEAPEYQSVFPEVRIATDTKAKSQWAIAGKKGKYVARGVGQGIHGFRATFICVDDPYAKIEDANSAVYRKRVEQWFDADIGSRALPGCKIFCIMTRFHGEDLTHHLKEQNKELPEKMRWEIVTIPAICFDPETDLMGRQLGDVLWSYYDHEYFQDKKIQFGHLGFALTYQQIDSAASPDSIAAQFQYYKVLPYLTDHATAKAMAEGVDMHQATSRLAPQRGEYIARTVLSVDTAAKTTERADYTVVQVWMEGRDGRHYLAHQERKKVEFNDMVSLIESTAKKWSCDVMLVEDKGQGTAYIQARGQTDFQRRLAPCPIIAINPGVQGKAFRFDEVTPLISAGEVYLDETAPWKDTLLVELGQFPDGAHDDQVDAMSQYLQYAKKNRRGRFGSRRFAKRG